MLDDDAFASTLSASASPQCSAIADEPASPSEDGDVEGSRSRSSNGSSCARRMRDAYYCGNDTGGMRHVMPAVGSRAVTDGESKHDASNRSSPQTLTPPACEATTPTSSACGRTTRSATAAMAVAATEDVIRDLRALRGRLQRSVATCVPTTALHESYADARRCAWCVPRPCRGTAAKSTYTSSHLP